ncbi:MAG: molybdenum hydroxylase [Denitrovibrio sp.]|nr:MAG: molybdenum hydroxylase [Denitrovibrio sp.]
MNYFEKLIIIRGGGDLASGVAVRLYNAGYKILMLETTTPSAIRRSVSFSQAVYDGKAKVEGIEAVLLDNGVEPTPEQIPLLVDPSMNILSEVKPLALIDAVIAKRNFGITKDLCDIVIALGPGFEAGKDCHAVIETKRGHNLGRVLYEGSAAPDSGVPGIISGIGKERVLHAENAGVLTVIKDIGDTVKKGDHIATIDGTPVKASIDGLIRGMIRSGYKVFKGMKIADIDPRVEEFNNCFTVSDKARALGGAVLEAILHLRSKNDRS